MVIMQPQAITKVSISALVISLPIIYVSLLRVPPSTLARDSTFWFLMSNSIIAIIATDSGVPFFSSASNHDHHHLSDVVLGDEQAVETFREDDYYRDTASVPLMVSSYEPTVPVDISCDVVGAGEQLPASGVVISSKAADTAGMEEGHALALIEGEGTKPSTDMVAHASALQICDEEEAPELEPTNANKGDATIVKGGQWAISPAPGIQAAPDDDDDNDDDLRQDRGSVQVVRPEVRPRCPVAEQSKPQPEEERDYWQLSDEELNRKVEEFITRFNRDMIQQEAAAV